MPPAGRDFCSPRAWGACLIIKDLSTETRWHRVFLSCVELGCYQNEQYCVFSHTSPILTPTCQGGVGKEKNPVSSHTRQVRRCQQKSQIAEGDSPAIDHNGMRIWYVVVQELRPPVRNQPIIINTKIHVYSSTAMDYMRCYGLRLLLFSLRGFLKVGNTTALSEWTVVCILTYLSHCNSILIKYKLINRSRECSACQTVLAVQSA